ncbi:MAG: hypothetical protein ACYC7E_12630 [Armatimonadota bacterium]
MGKCGYCGTRIFLGGERRGDTIYCNQTCLQRHAVVKLTDSIPQEEVDAYIWEVFRGRCPECGGEGPIDVHISYRIFSVLMATVWSSHPMVSCKRCGTKKKLLDMVFSLFLGWWGLPWGIIITPIQIARNVFGIFSNPIITNRPSDTLITVLKTDIAMRIQQNNAVPGKSE